LSESNLESGPRTSAARLEELEIRIGYLDDLVDSINRTLFRQQQQIEQLGRALAELQRQAHASPQAAPTGAGDEIPPHY